MFRPAPQPCAFSPGPWSPDSAPLGNLHSWVSSDPEAQRHPSSCAQHTPSPGTGLVQPLLDIKPPKGSLGVKASLAEPSNLSNEWSPNLIWIHLGPQLHHKISGRPPPTRDAPDKGKRRGGEKDLMARVCAEQVRPSLGWLVRAGLSGQQQEVDKWLADSGQGASFPQRDPAGNTALWRVGQWAAPVTPF